MLYSLLGIPLARVAERVSRVNIIARAIFVWSTFTALCGAAGSFATLAAFRLGVGIGEAGLSPSAHSLISDYFGPRERTSALSLYNLGIPLGIMVGAMAGGWLTQNFSWRLAFVLVGLPGALVALAIKLSIKSRHADSRTRR
jgi:MFS family permease